MKFVVYRDSNTLRLRKIVIEIYSHSGALLDRSRMFGGLFSSVEARYSLAKRINERLAKRVPICQIFEQAGMGG